MTAELLAHQKTLCDGPARELTERWCKYDGVFIRGQLAPNGVVVLAITRFQLLMPAWRCEDAFHYLGSFSEAFFLLLTLDLMVVNEAEPFFLTHTLEQASN